MHELSIISSVVDSVLAALPAYPGARVLQVRLRVGQLTAVVEDSLQFCYEIATQDTPLQGSLLVVNTVPVLVHCEACHTDAPLASLQSFRCSNCGEPATDIRQGRELEIESIELEDAPPLQDPPPLEDPLRLENLSALEPAPALQTSGSPS